MVLGFLVNSFSPEITAHVLRLQHAKEVWSAISMMFSTPSRTCINHVCGALNNTKKGNLTITQFFTKMRGFSSELAAAVKPVEDDEMIGYILNGLDSSYNDLVSLFNGNLTPLLMISNKISLSLLRYAH
jgi:hypothetical protein